MISKLNLFNVYLISRRISVKLAFLRNWIYVLEAVSFVICLVSMFFKEFKLALFILVIMSVLLLILIFEVIILFISSSLSKKNTEFKYLPGGSLSDWYEPTYNYNEKISWLDYVLGKLEDEGVRLESIRILSTSANKGKYEYEISKRYPKSKIIATDISIPKDHVGSSGNFTYLSEENNALNANSYLAKINIENVDLIWDIKGALWYSGKRKKLEILLNEYYNILDVEGVIIFDAYDYSREYFKNTLNSEAEGYRESSTYTRIKRKLEKSKWFNIHFDLDFIGDGEYKVAIMKKKEKRKNQTKEQGV
ncbi:hypothetical protein [Paenibacillus amylolyticus]|uniref:hypothetical protein n=1 Tax=Paenibacillus amylolyticus TaxID=1451 RepID=UPI000FDA8B05|nr:hypothetical protein [Paenibacillus amylolyticus]